MEGPSHYIFGFCNLHKLHHYFYDKTEALTHVVGLLFTRKYLIKINILKNATGQHEDDRMKTGDMKLWKLDGQILFLDVKNTLLLRHDTVFGLIFLDRYMQILYLLPLEYWVIKDSYLNAHQTMSQLDFEIEVADLGIPKLNVSQKLSIYVAIKIVVLKGKLKKKYYR